jgi:hypothetical protein
MNNGSFFILQDILWMRNMYVVGPEDISARPIGLFVHHPAPWPVN